MTPGLAEAVERGDLDELLRVIDGRCAARDWDGLAELRERCRRALERGRQLWPATHHIEYRLALEAPAAFAATVLVEGAGRFTLGPIAEVAASTHRWSELGPRAPATPTASLCAHECVVRGEDLRGVALPGPDPLELPLHLAPWEPRYAVATYRSHAADFPAPDAPVLAPVRLPSHRTERADDPDACRALEDLARTWATESEGTVDCAAVHGGALDAIAALGRSEARVAAVEPASAIAWMAWAAASGGARGRRRGAAPGRLDAWVAAGAVAGLGGEWPVPASTIGTALDRLRWYLWDGGGRGDLLGPGDGVGGWALRLAVEDPHRGIAYALAAHDPA